MANKRPRLVTMTCMILVNDKGAIYGVYKGKLRYRKGCPYVNIHDAEHVGRVDVPVGEKPPTYLEMAKRFETPDAPAYDFGR